jgi:hypothetical protein
MTSYFTVPGIEIELRFGSFSKNFENGKEYFDNNVDKNYFEKILHSFENYKEWQNIFVDNSIEYITTNNKKIIKKESGHNIIKKNKIYKKDSILKNIPFDVRFSINQELNNNIIDNKENNQTILIRKKSRKSFEDHNYRYDLSYVNEIKNNITKDKYEIELEILINNNTLEWNNDYLNDFIICKVQDIINILEEKDTDIQKNIVLI